jgi:hypothetical protein
VAASCPNRVHICAASSMKTSAPPDLGWPVSLELRTAIRKGGRLLAEVGAHNVHRGYESLHSAR